MILHTDILGGQVPFELDERMLLTSSDVPKARPFGLRILVQRSETVALGCTHGRGNAPDRVLIAKEQSTAGGADHLRENLLAFDTERRAASSRTLGGLLVVHAIETLEDTPNYRKANARLFNAIERLGHYKSLQVETVRPLPASVSEEGFYAAVSRIGEPPDWVFDIGEIAAISLQPALLPNTA